MRYLEIFLAEAGEYEACGIFNIKHLILILMTVGSIWRALKKTSKKSKEEIHSIIKCCTIILWIFEIFRILFRIIRGSITSFESYLPLYYCSLFLYAGLLSSFARGKFKRIGDIFLSTGGIVGGFIFIIFPSTSLPIYPMTHFMSLHSFLYHGIMVYIGILMNITNYTQYDKSDIFYYSKLVGTLCLVSLFVNHITGSNLMFISRSFPGEIGRIAGLIVGKLYTPLMVMVHMFSPFYAVCAIKNVMIKKVLHALDKESDKIMN